VRLLVLTGSLEGGKGLLPALEFLDHELADASLTPDAVSHIAGVDAALVDATRDLAGAATTCRAIAASDVAPPVLVVAGEAQLAALKPTWGFDDWTLPTAEPAEIETRLRLMCDRARDEHRSRGTTVGDLTIDEDTYIVRLRGHPLDLTFREFELLRYLAAHPRRVFAREQLLSEVWGYDYYGGARTVDVHIRRLRAKLGPEHESLIGTVRGVGYKLDPHGASRHGESDQQDSDDD
jgi:DNA-binding response OmpR family regulator